MAAASKARTTISQAAARLATTVAPRGEAEQLVGRVLVEDEVVVATDSRRLIVVGEPHVDGLFSEREAVALVPCDALRDAQREAERVSVEAHQCTALGEHGESLRFVPFGPHVGDDWPDWRKAVPGHADTKAIVNPDDVADVLKLLATLGCKRVSIGSVGFADLVAIEGELPNEQSVRLVLRHADAPEATLPGMPAYEKRKGEDDETQPLQFEQEGDTATEPDQAYPPTRRQVAARKAGARARAKAAVARSKKPRARRARR